jgi:mono/diheme cytochrome c family protein
LLEGTVIVFRGLALLFVAILLVGVGCSGGGPGGGDANRGRQLFISKQCTTCHTIAGIPEATGTIGPDQTHIATVAATRKPGMAADAYIRESIKDPAAFIVPDFPAPSNGGMVLPIPVNDAEINDLVAFLMTQK